MCDMSSRVDAIDNNKSITITITFQTHLFR